MSVDIAKVMLQTLASLGVPFPSHIFEILQASYLQMAREAVDQYAADAIINGLPYDRHSEAQSVESFSKSIRLAGERFREDPTDLPRIPPWNRVMSALPDFLDRLSAVVADENRKADLAIAAQDRNIIGLEQQTAPPGSSASLASPS